MTSIEALQQTNARLGLRVRLWRDIASSSALSCTYLRNNTNRIIKAILSSPTWVRMVDVDFANYPYAFHLEVSDYGAYTTLSEDVNSGATSVHVNDITGFAPGNFVIFRKSGATDKLLVTSIDYTNKILYFNGSLPKSYTVADDSTVSDERWYRVADGYLDSDGLVTFGGVTEDFPMISAYGKYWRIVSDVTHNVMLDGFLLYEDTYYDLTEYVYGNVDVSYHVDYAKGDSPLITASIDLLNVDDRFNRRNANSPYIDFGGVNHLEVPRRLTVEWIGYESDWKQALNADNEPDWQMLIAFTTRQWNISRDDHSIATVVGEVLSRLTYSVDIPLVGSEKISNLIRDWVLTEDYRKNLVVSSGDITRAKIAVVSSENERTYTSYNESIGRGTFGNPVAFYTDASEEPPHLLYGGMFGIACDNNFLYTSHELETIEGNYRRGMLVVKRHMNGVPTGDSYIFDEDQNQDIEAGDLCIIGNYLWVHTAQIGVTYNVFKIDMSTWTVTSSYTKKGGAGHYPVHATTDGTYLYVLYNGGSEGRVLYKVDPSDYSTVWSHTFSGSDNIKINFGNSGLIMIGSGTLVIFSRACFDTNRISGECYAVLFKINSSSPWLTYKKTIKLSKKFDGTTNGSFLNIFGDASSVVTNEGVFVLTGPCSSIPVNKNSPSGGSSNIMYITRSGIFTNVGKIKFWTNCGKIVNARDEYDSPNAEKEYANFPLEEVYIDGELLDNGYNAATGEFTGTYSGDIKITSDYSINLLTGEILFLSPPFHDSLIVANYDYKPVVHYFKADNLPRWETVRKLANAGNRLAVAEKEERVGYKTRKQQEDAVFTSASNEQYIFRRMDIIHPSNPNYTLNTIQVSNAFDNQFYVEGIDYNISYENGIYTLTEIGNSLEGHILLSYFTGPLHLLDNDAVYSGANIIAASEMWDFSEIYNQITVEGSKYMPSVVPIVINETFAVSPRVYNIDQKFSKIQLLQTSGQYNWDATTDTFEKEISANVANSGVILKFDDPLIVGTTAWRVKEADGTKVEKIALHVSGGAQWVKCEWYSPFYEPGTTLLSTNYDVALDNPYFWRVATKNDESELGEAYKTGEYIYVKKVRYGGIGSDACNVYAYRAKYSHFYIDSTGCVREGILNYIVSPNKTSAPDKRMEILLEPIGGHGYHLFRTPGTYDDIDIPAMLCMNIGAVRINYDGLSMDVYNYSDDVNYIRVRVTGYPITEATNIIVKAEDRVREDASLSAIDIYGQRTLTINNDYLQSLGMAKYLGYTLLDWCKKAHTVTTLVVKFMPNVALLDRVCITSKYGNFSSSELWLVIGIRHSVVAGAYEFCTTTLEVIDVPPNPSAQGYQT